jgi:selenide,water dikinase
VLGKLARQHDPNVLVGFDKADDAGVYQIAPELALVQTTDFFTPIVDDPFTFGQIAAANALSDVYAMGGKPLTSLALVCFPEKGDLAILEQILGGGLAKMTEAGCTVIGGHSIRDEEIKFGYAVTGTVHPKRVFTNSGAQPGDALILTKPLGTGVISTAVKRGKAQAEWVEAATQSMTTLNRAAAEVIGACDATAVGRDGSAHPVHAVTDVTGFGLIGHAREMALGSGVSLKFHASKIPLLDGALECVRAGHIPGGLKANRDFAECLVGYENTVADELKTMLFDPQTSGGLLIAVAEAFAEELKTALRQQQIESAIVGVVLPQSNPLIRITA